MAVFTEKAKQVVTNPGTGTIEKEILVDPALFQGTNDLFARITLHPAVPFLSTSIWGTTKPITC